MDLGKNIHPEQLVEMCSFKKKKAPPRWVPKPIDQQRLPSHPSLSTPKIYVEAEMCQKGFQWFFCHLKKRLKKSLRKISLRSFEVDHFSLRGDFSKKACMNLKANSSCLVVCEKASF